MVESTITRYSTQLLERRWLSKKAFEMRLKKPPAFEFMPGQRICLGYKAVERDYSLVCAPDDPDLVLCIRYVKDGMLSTELETAQIGAQFQFTGPDGYFVFRPSDRPAIFVATGTGIAPFCSMLRSGVTEFTLLHGVETTEDLYYTSEFKSSAKSYVACLSQTDVASDEYFKGTVTDYLKKHLTAGIYDFYLCGRREMVRDVTLLIDEKYQGSYIYTEIFY